MVLDERRGRFLAAALRGMFVFDARAPDWYRGLDRMDRFSTGLDILRIRSSRCS
jgi:hypothetical protein